MNVSTPLDIRTPRIYVTRMEHLESMWHAWIYAAYRLLHSVAYLHLSTSKIPNRCMKQMKLHVTDACNNQCISILVFSTVAQIGNYIWSQYNSALITKDKISITVWNKLHYQKSEIL